MAKSPPIRKIAFVGDYLPRKCGIATFTTDLCQSVAARFPETSCLAVPVNDIEGGYDYPDEVRFEIAEKELESYQRAADFLNLNNVELVCVQHEFGIYGGTAGSHVLALLRELRMPIVTTLHTVLRNPNDEQRRVMAQLGQFSDRFVVMTEKGRSFLRETYGVPEKKIDLIQHGIPDVPFVDPNYYKDQFGMEGRTVLLTFGLLSPNKGIEHVINALPQIVKEYPEVVYLVLGATHPNLLKNEGESYRLSLQRRAEALGVEKHVIFYNQFVTTEQLTEFIGAADLYITPYLNEAQITSGTLAYSFGAGKAVISTPYWHAQELLAEDRGILVPFADSKAVAGAVVDLLKNETRRHTLRRNAYRLGREMIWPRVAERYMEIFQQARSGRRPKASRAFAARTLSNQRFQLPPLKLDHLHTLTDSTGILQHAIHTVPNYAEGYTVDDNARALILTVLLEESGGPELQTLASRYLAFLHHAFDREARTFHNVMSYDRKWLDEPGDSDDCHGRALWALSTVLGRTNNEGFRLLAGELFELALGPTLEFKSPRAWGFTLLAIHEYLRRLSGDRAANSAREVLAGKLMALYQANAGSNWPWFEDRLAYDNAVLPHALILAGHWTNQPAMIEAGLSSLRWLAELQTSDAGNFAPIGSNGFYVRGGEKARFDQQPLESLSMVSACLEAHRVTNESFWAQEARRAFEWFLGRNDLGLPLYDSSTGGCRDGLHWDRVNQNEGAESTLAFYVALAEMRLTRNVLSTFDKAVA